MAIQQLMPRRVPWAGVAESIGQGMGLGIQGGLQAMQQRQMQQRTMQALIQGGIPPEKAEMIANLPPELQQQALKNEIESARANRFASLLGEGQMPQHPQQISTNDLLRSNVTQGPSEIYNPAQQGIPGVMGQGLGSMPGLFNGSIAQNPIQQQPQQAPSINQVQSPQKKESPEEWARRAYAAGMNQKEILDTLAYKEAVRKNDLREQESLRSAQREDRKEITDSWKEHKKYNDMLTERKLKNRTLKSNNKLVRAALSTGKVQSGTLWQSVAAKYNIDPGVWQTVESQLVGKILNANAIDELAKAKGRPGAMVLSSIQKSMASLALTNEAIDRMSRLSDLNADAEDAETNSRDELAKEYDGKALPPNWEILVAQKTEAKLNEIEKKKDSLIDNWVRKVYKDAEKDLIKTPNLLGSGINAAYNYITAPLSKAEMNQFEPGNIVEDDSGQLWEILAGGERRKL